MADFNINFGKRLLQLIKNEGLTQTKFAEIMGLEIGTLNRYVKGRVPESHILLKIADYFGVTIDFLITGRSPWELKKDIEARYSRGIFIEGHRVAENRVRHEVIAEVAEADEEMLLKVKQIMDLVRGESKDKQKKAGNDG